jgi:hypothetical protein
MPDYESEVPHSLGDNRRKWHLDRSVPISALVAITLAVCSLVGTGIFWYTEVESRIESQKMVSEKLRQDDDRLALQIKEQSDNWRLLQQRQEARTQRSFDLLRNEMDRMSGLLEKIVLNTRRGQNETNTP